MKLQLIVLAVCLSAASAGIPKKIFKKYMKTKMMQSCFGEEVLSDMSNEMAAASKKCLGQAGPALPKIPQAKLLSLMSNVTCVLREMKMLNAENAVDYDSIKARISALPLPKEQIEDLQHGMDDCREYSSCLPIHGDHMSPVMTALGQQLAFFKCFKMAKVESCMRQDFRGDVFPALMLTGMGLHEDHGLGELIATALLEEVDGVRP